MKALDLLANEKLPVKVAHNIGMIYKRCLHERKESSDAFKKLIDNHFKKDIKGNLIPAKDSQDKIIQDRFVLINETTEGNTAYIKEREEFMSIEVKIPRYKLALDTLVTFDGRELFLEAALLAELSDLFEDMEEAECSIVPEATPEPLKVVPK